MKLTRINNSACQHLIKKQYFQDDKLPLCLCRKCGLIFLKQKEKNPQKLYQNYYHNEIIGRFKFEIELVVKLFRLFRAFKVWTIAPQAKSILDIGCGRGWMLYYLKKYYHYQLVVGTQLNHQAASFVRNKLGLKIYEQDLLNFRLPQNNFEIVTLWHVLEHLQKPEQYLAKIYKLLKPKGKLIIEVPNFSSWTRRLTGKYWLGLDLKYHLNFFTPKSLTAMLLRQHFKINNIHTFSLEYSVFFSVQSLVSWLTKTDQLFFNWLQGAKFTAKIIFHLLLFIILTPLCLVINLLLYYSQKGEVLLITVEKK